MKKLFLLGFVLLPFIAGCEVGFAPDLNVSVDIVVGSGQEYLSGAWGTAKDYASGFYSDQVQPFVDAAKVEVDSAVQTAKDAYNTEVEKINDRIQEKADQAKDEVNKIKVE